MNPLVDYFWPTHRREHVTAARFAIE